MTDFTAALDQSYVLRERITSTQDQLTNASTLSIQHAILKGTGTGRYRGAADNRWTSIVDGDTRTGLASYDFRPLSQGQALVFASYSKVIEHDPDGTKTIIVSASFDDKDPLGLLDGSTGNRELVLPPIDRNIAYAGVDGDWVLAELFVGVDGDWVPALPHAGVDGEWKLVTA